MKYYTKEWYKNCQKFIPLSLEANEKAATYSEEFFQALYKRRSQNEFYLRQINENSFRLIYESIVNSLNANLPFGIRQEIADIRVLALGVTTKEMKRRLEKFNRMQIAEMDRPSQEYSRVYKRISHNLKSLTNIDLDYFSFHDSRILSTHFDNSDFIIELESDYEPVELLQLVMKNARIIKNEDQYITAWWIYDEMYPVDDKIELHVLLYARVSDNNDEQMELKEIILQASYLQLNCQRIEKRQYE